MVSTLSTLSLTPPNGTNQRMGVSLARSMWAQHRE
jgi:hypothetical protein